jgi:hypothetical protein
MSRFQSPYYPPRAAWYSPLFRLGSAVRRLVWLDRIHLPEGISTRAFIAGLVIPGFAFLVRRERLIGRAVMLSYALLALVFIIWLGYPIANVGFGLMLSIHVSSILFLLNPWLAEARIAFRIATGLALLLVVGGGLYAPVRHQVATHWLLPLRIHQNDVVIVQKFSTPSSVNRGDRIAYSLESLSVGDAHRQRGAVRTQAGIGCGVVLAGAGDHIRFTLHTFEINGVARPRLPHMPVEAEFVVPEKHWFIWPELAISNPANAAEAAISDTLLQLATVPEAQFIGKPFKRWFWRRQPLS